MRSRPSKTVCTAPMAVASDGSVLVNAYQLATKDGLAAAIEAARRTALVVFVGVVVPAKFGGKMAKDIDDATADVAGRLGAKLVRPGRR